MKFTSSSYERLVATLPGAFRLRHGDEMIFAFAEDRKRWERLPSSERARRASALFSDFARTFLREWLCALPWEAIVILLWNTALIAVAIVLRVYVMVEFYALIAASIAVAPLLRRLRQWHGKAACAAAAAGGALLAFFIPKVLFALARRDPDAEELLYLIQMPMIFLVVICLIRNLPWHDRGTVPIYPRESGVSGWLRYAPYCAALFGILVFSIVQKRTGAAGASLCGSYSIVLLFTLFQTIWRRKEHYRAFKTYGYPQGR